MKSTQNISTNWTEYNFLHCYFRKKLPLNYPQTRTRNLFTKLLHVEENLTQKKFPFRWRYFVSVSLHLPPPITPSYHSTKISRSIVWHHFTSKQKSIRLLTSIFLCVLCLRCDILHRSLLLLLFEKKLNENLEERKENILMSFTKKKSSGKKKKVFHRAEKEDFSSMIRGRKIIFFQLFCVLLTFLLIKIAAMRIKVICKWCC